MMEVDAFIDSGLYNARLAAGEFWDGVTIFFRRFRPYGFNRAIFEALGEAMTLGTAAALIMLALAIPSSMEVARNWESQEQFAVTFLDRYGREVGQRGVLHSDAVPIEELPDNLIKAVLATEDRRFFDHFGIDIVGLVRAMTENVRANSVVQGGSTVTQQLAKNLFLTNERTLERKIKEAFLALWLEANLTKEEILKLYLDRAYMGGGTFGVAAAARFYFDKDVRDVTLAEAAMLAGLFKAPARFAPHIDLPAARGRANEVLTNMVQAEFMTEGQVTGARREPADVVLRQANDSPDYFLDWAFGEVKDFIIDNRLPTRSVIVRTTIDMDLQRGAEEAIQFFLRKQGQEYNVSQSAAVLIENNGAVRAIVGGRDYGVSQFNRATSAERQAGSSFKTYVYAAAISAGLDETTVVRDEPVTWRGWSPQNYNRRFAGRVNLATAFARSINTVPVKLARDHLGGTSPIVSLAEKMGVESPVISHHTMVLGTSGMTVMDQATGYLSLASGGVTGLRHGFTQIRAQSGEVLYDRRRDAPRTEQIFTPEQVETLNRMLVNVTEWGTGRRAALEGIKVAGKTGTTQSYRDAWFSGYTGNFTAAVWYGNDNYTPTNRLTGGRLPAQTWQRIMSYAHRGIDLAPLAGVEDSIPASPEPSVEVAQDDAGAPFEMFVLSEQSVRFLSSLDRKLANLPELSEKEQEVAATR
ncbi:MULTISPECIES: PBP1A family penicillin-binding protein [unclassified Roseitalea]|uniref:transglycosylase domain-containing protein n=1 Tax=unclassified Roseitalea TaxID=2639107 RepID=UPI00273D5411|nr:MULTISPECIES: PBP1A family penicillin-binding protein [unclassified Roseitalea]